MPEPEAMDLLNTKFELVQKDASEKDIPVRIDTKVEELLFKISGGHPHILQLLGSHLIQEENKLNSGVINWRSLLNSFRRICYTDRAEVYTSTLHNLEIHNHLDGFISLCDKMLPDFPTKIDKESALDVVNEKCLQWLVENNIIKSINEEEYGLVDEFLRIRIIFDNLVTAKDEKRIEFQSLSTGSIRPEYIGDNIENLGYLDDSGIAELYNDDDDDSFIQ